MRDQTPLKNATTFKIGGEAKQFSVCGSIEELHECVMRCKNRGIPWFVLGGGSNILVSDDGFPGLVIKLGQGFKRVKFNGSIVDVGAGVFLPVLSRLFLREQWGGLEFICDIPGTIGGAVRINAGTKQGEIKDHFISAKVLTHDGKIKILYKTEMGFSHRHSCLLNTNDIVLSGQFSRPYFDAQKNIKVKIRQIIDVRRKNQPGNRRNCGSVFKTPSGGKPAGWYIDQAGLKGTRIGDAMVAHEHANWIVNLGNATAEHVRNLIDKIQGVVFRKFGLKLEREVIYIPEDILGV